MKKYILTILILAFSSDLLAQGQQPNISQLIQEKIKYVTEEVLFPYGTENLINPQVYIQMVTYDEPEQGQYGIGFGAVAYCTDPSNGSRMFCSGWTTAHVVYVQYGIPKRMVLNNEPREPRRPPACGSIIDYAGRNVTEQIALDGTPFKLSYSSAFNPQIAKNRKAVVPNDFANKSYTFHKVQMALEGSSLPPQEIIYNPQSESISTFEWDGVAQNQSDNIFISRANVQISMIYNLNFGEISENLALEMSGIPVAYAPDPVNTIPENPILVVPSTVASLTGQIVIYHPEVWGMNGWTVDVHHYFDRDSLLMYAGHGEKVLYKKFKTITLQGYDGDLIAVPNKSNPDEYYVFDLQGRHLETRSVRLKKAIYKFHYDLNYRLTRIENIFGKFTDFSYVGNQLTKIVAPYGQETTISGDGQNILAVTNSLAKVHTMTYGSQNQLLTFKALDGSTTTFSYDAEGNMLSEEKDTGIVQTIANLWQNGTETLQLIHNWGAALKQEVTSLMDRDVVVFKNNVGDVVATETFFRPVGGMQQHTYVEQGISSVTTQKRHHPFWGEDVTETTAVTTELYSPAGNVTANEQVNAQYSFADSHPDSLSSLTVMQHTSQSGSSSSYMNFLNRTFQVTLPTGAVERMYYNENGQVTEVRPHSAAPTYLSYDADGRLLQTSKGTHSESYTYDAFGNVQTVTTSTGQVTSYTRDAQGKVLTTTLPNGEQVLTEYTDGGEIRRITTPGNQVHTFQMSLGDYLSAYITPSNQSTQYIYDQDKRLRRVTKPSGKYMEYTYSANGEMSELETAIGSYLYSDFDRRGRAQQITSADGIRTNMSWLGIALQSEAWFDTDGSQLGVVSYGFHADSFLLNQISLNGQTVATYEYDNQTKEMISLNNVSFSHFEQASPHFKRTTESYDHDLYVAYVAHDSQNGDKPLQTVTANVTSGENLLLDIQLERSYDGFGQASASSSLTRNSMTGLLHSYAELKPVGLSPKS